jgi:hypothetical protein
MEKMKKFVIVALLVVLLVLVATPRMTAALLHSAAPPVPVNAAMAGAAETRGQEGIDPVVARELAVPTDETVARARVEGDSVALFWEPVVDAVAYAIYRVEEGGPLLLTSDAVEGQSYIDLNPPRSDDLRYVIQPLFPKGVNRNVPSMLVRAIGTFSATGRVQAMAVHGPNDIISDAEFQASVTLPAIREFLVSKSSFLSKNIVDHGGATIDPAAVISNAGSVNAISPWVIITMLEKEMSLVTLTSSPGSNSTAMKCAMGYGCDNATYAGFANQVSYASRSLRGYLTNLSTRGDTGYGIPPWKIGVAHPTEDCLTVTPANAATAALYTYNPLAGGGWGGCRQQFGANYRFWNLFYNIFRFGDTTTNAIAEMQSPKSGSTLTGSTQTFTWTRGQAAEVFLYVGTAVGSNNIYGNSLGTNTSATVYNLPTNGTTLYVRLYSYINGAWQYIDYQYKASSSSGGGTTLAKMQSPVPGSRLTGSAQTFTWTRGQATQVFLYVGTTVGSNNIYGNNLGTNTSATVYNLPTKGITLYVRLFSYINGAWQYIDYQYRAR